MRRYIIKDEDVINAFKRWNNPALKNQKMHTSFLRSAICKEHRDKEILQYDVRQKLKSMAARGIVEEVKLGRNATAWMLKGEYLNGTN